MGIRLVTTTLSVAGLYAVSTFSGDRPPASPTLLVRQPDEHVVVLWRDLDTKTQIEEHTPNVVVLIIANQSGCEEFRFSPRPIGAAEFALSTPGETLFAVGTANYLPGRNPETFYRFQAAATADIKVPHRYLRIGDPNAD